MIYFKVASSELGRAIAEDLKKVNAKELKLRDLPFMKEKDVILLYKPNNVWLALALASNARTILYLDKPNSFITKIVTVLSPFPPNATLPNPKPLKRGEALCLSPLSDDYFNASKAIYFLKRLGIDVFITSEHPLLSSLIDVKRVEPEECNSFLAFYKELDAEKAFEAFSLAQVGLVASGPKVLKDALKPLAPCIKWVKNWSEVSDALGEAKGCEVKGNLVQSLSSFITE